VGDPKETAQTKGRRKDEGEPYWEEKTGLGNRRKWLNRTAREKET